MLPPSCSTSCRCPAVALQRAAWAAAHVCATPRAPHASPLPGAIAPCEDGTGRGPSAAAPGSPGGLGSPLPQHGDATGSEPCPCVPPAVRCRPRCPHTCQALPGPHPPQPGERAPLVPLRCAPPRLEGLRGAAASAWGGAGPWGAAMLGRLAPTVQTQRLQRRLDPVGRGLLLPPHLIARSPMPFLVGHGGPGAGQAVVAPRIPCGPIPLSRSRQEQPPRAPGSCSFAACWGPSGPGPRSLARWRVNRPLRMESLSSALASAQQPVGTAAPRCPHTPRYGPVG